jgi:Protein of unknown function (DUF3341)
MKGVYGLYPDGHAAQRAVNGLRSAGVKDDDITIITGAPMEDFEFSHIGAKSYMWYIACLGGLIGFAVSTGLAYLTETDWPLPTGGMPIVSWWPNLIIMFEMTMLGAILATVITLIITARLGRRRPAFYDPAISDGKILVGVESPRDGSTAQIERALQVGPDVQLKTI